MIPLADVIPSPTRPVVVLALIAAQGVLGASLVVGSGDAASAMPTGVGIVAAIANLLFLWLFGPTVEDRVGHLRFVVLFLVSGIAGGLAVAPAHLLSTPPAVAAGAAAAGIIGAHLTLYPRSRILVLVPTMSGADLVDVPAPFVAGFWLIAQIAGGASPWSLLAGCLAGAAALLVLRRRERLRVHWWGA